LNKTICLIPIILILLVSTKLIINFNRGFDLTDESYYLLSAERPEDIRASVTQFGFYTGLLYKAVNGSIYGFRVLGFSILILLSLGFGYLFNNLLENHININVDNFEKTANISLITLTTLLYYGWWLPSPSYNWLNLVSIFLVSSGLIASCFPILKNKRAELFSIYFGATLIGIGGGLSFLTKPTSAIALALLALFWIEFFGHPKKKLVLIKVSFLMSLFFLIFHVMVFEEGPKAFLNKILLGHDLLLSLGSHGFTSAGYSALKDILRIPYFILTKNAFGYIWLIIYVIYFITIRKLKDKSPFILNIVSLIAFLTIFFKLNPYYKGGENISLGYGIVLLFVSFIIICLINFLFSSVIFKSQNFNLKSLGNLWILPIFIFLFSFAYSFGSGNPLIYNVFGSTVFIVASFMLLIYYQRTTFGSQFFFQIFILMISKISFDILFYDAFEKPYRLGNSIEKQTEMVIVGRKNSPIFVDILLKEYIVSLKKNFFHFEGTWETGLLDFTGETPGAVFITGAKFIGTQWLVGGYPGSERFTLKALNLIPKNVIENSLVLTSINGQRPIPISILEKFHGKTFKDYYFSPSKDLIFSQRNEFQILWKPKEKNP
jgi:hypothetical protein